MARIQLRANADRRQRLTTYRDVLHADLSKALEDQPRSRNDPLPVSG